MRVFSLAGVLVLASLAYVTGQNLTYTPDPTWQAPPEAAAKANPLANSPEAEGGGRKLFKRECAQCHGKDGRGLKKAADLHLPVVQTQTDGALFWKITNGNTRHGMPSFSRLPEPQRWQLVLHIRSLVARDSSN